jgi:PKD repeat protein
MRWTLVSLLLLIGTLAPADDGLASGGNSLAGQGQGFDLLLSEGMAPCAIHVIANIDPEDGLTLRCQWDFGDPQGAHNTLTGFNAAHLYTRPGQYVVTLTESSAAAPKVFTKKIFISADRRRAVFISMHGSDAHTGLAEGNAVRSISRAMALITDGTSLLLHRGEVFDLDTTLTLFRRNIVVATYGQGAPPILRRGSPNFDDLISTAQTAADVVIRDLVFDSMTPDNWNKDGAARAVHIAGTNIALDHLIFANVNDATNCEARPRGVLVQDCVVPAVTSMRGYFMWGAGSQLVLLGNSAPNSTREHIVRLGGADHVAISFNDFDNISRVNTGDPNDIGKGTLVLQKCSNVYASENTLHNGIGVGPLDGADGVKDPLGEARCVVVEHNAFLNANINIHPGSHDVAIRDNTIRMDGFPAINATPRDATQLPSGQPAYPNRNISNIQILRNTATNQSANGEFLKLYGGAPPGSIILSDNTYRAPNLHPGQNETAVVFVLENDLHPFAQIANNTWPLPRTSPQIFYIAPKWYDTAGYRTAEQWSQFPQVKEDKIQN